MLSPHSLICSVSKGVNMLAFSPLVCVDIGCVVNIIVHILGYILCMLQEDSSRGSTTELRPYALSKQSM